MRYTYLTILLLFNFSLNFAQEIPFTFSYDSQEFEYLNESISVNNGETWGHNFVSTIELGFSFMVAGNTYDSIQVRSGGIDFPDSGPSLSRRLLALSGLLVDKGESESLSPISYHYGYSPEHEENIFKIEWKNAGVRNFGFMPSSPEDYVNIQVWLFETSQEICIHFGPHQLDADTYLNNLNAAGALGIKLLIEGNFIGPFGNGDMPETLIDECAPGNCLANINTYPSEGMRYCFSPTDIVNSSADPQAYSTGDHILIYPNPVLEQLAISLNDDTRAELVELRIIDALGKVWYSAREMISESPLDIDLAALPAGLYSIFFQGEEVRVVKTLLKL